MPEYGPNLVVLGHHDATAWHAGFGAADFPYDAAAVDVVLLELLAAVHLTVRSPAVTALEEYIRKELGS